MSIRICSASQFTLAICFDSSAVLPIELTDRNRTNEMTTSHTFRISGPHLRSHVS
jgi:hypothetical protein